MEVQIKDKKNIIIVPDGILAFVPFETLIGEDGKYLVEDYHISYIQSMGIREFISKRQYREDRKPLLAFGGAVYDEMSYGVDIIENGTQLALLTKRAYADIENNRAIRVVYASLGAASWNNLPGTLNEVKNIKKVVKKADIFTGENVTEKNIKAFSRNGKLSEYKVIHFATHSLVVPEMPELSAVVLSQFENDQGKEDGYLRMGEIAELDIKADFVNLSSCETGLGKIYGGEGVVGLTQSFLLAGANAVSVSLWRVADESTSQFMVSMYDRVQDKDISYAVAMTEVKRRFITGNYGEEYKDPYYWAPFVYYGKDYEKTEEQRKHTVERHKPEEEKWSKWQDNMRTAFDEVIKYENNDDVSASEMVVAWQYIIDNTNDNNPYSTEDEELRRRAMERLQYWKDYGKTKPAIEKPPVTIRKKPRLEKAYAKTPRLNLRASKNTYYSMSVLKFYHHISIRKEKKWGFYCHSTINHEYELKVINGDKVVLDHATNLMWHQSGSGSIPFLMTWNSANKWVNKLNQKKYAGYYDWRLPTLEEASSLLESSKKNSGLYIDPVFNKKQKWIWTCDEYKGQSLNQGWFVNFRKSYISIRDINYCGERHYVRPVRSMK